MHILSLRRYLYIYTVFGRHLRIWANEYTHVHAYIHVLYIPEFLLGIINVFHVDSY